MLLVCATPARCRRMPEDARAAPRGLAADERKRKGGARSLDPFVDVAHHRRCGSTLARPRCPRGGCPLDGPHGAVGGRFGGRRAAATRFGVDVAGIFESGVDARRDCPRLASEDKNIRLYVASQYFLRSYNVDMLGPTGSYAHGSLRTGLPTDVLGQTLPAHDRPAQGPYTARSDRRRELTPHAANTAAQVPLRHMAHPDVRCWLRPPRASGWVPGEWQLLRRSSAPQERNC